MKKLLSLFLIFSFAFSLISCTSSTEVESPKPSESSEANASLSSDKESTQKEKEEATSKSEVKKDSNEKQSEKTSKQSSEKKEESKKEDSKKEIDKSKEKKPKTTSSPKNTDNKKITIVIDPGHSNKSSNSKEPNSPGSNVMKLKDTLGSTGINSKVPEYKTTVGVSLELAKILRKDGYNAIMTKDDVQTQMSNIERAKVGNNSNANLLIRIHCDGVDAQSAHGASMLVPATKGYVTNSIANKSASYGRKIINTYTAELGLHNRGLVTRSDLTGFNWSKVPVVLLELGFISNPKEDALISNQTNYSKIAKAIADGINKCF